VEWLIGTIRREYFDQIFFWNNSNLEQKLKAFQDYYNTHRVHSSLGGNKPIESTENPSLIKANFHEFNWEKHCRGLIQLPVAV